MLRKYHQNPSTTFFNKFLSGMQTSPTPPFGSCPTPPVELTVPGFDVELPLWLPFENATLPVIS